MQNLKNVFWLYLLSWLNLHLQCPPVIIAEHRMFLHRENQKYVKVTFHLMNISAQAKVKAVYRNV